MGNVDNYKAGKMAPEYLYGKVHRKVACVTFALPIFSVYYKMEGFVRKAGKLYMEVEIIYFLSSIGENREIFTNSFQFIYVDVDKDQRFFNRK